jgi:hypothetical protein
MKEAPCISCTCRGHTLSDVKYVKWLLLTCAKPKKKNEKRAVKETQLNCAKSNLQDVEYVKENTVQSCRTRFAGYWIQYVK